MNIFDTVISFFKRLRVAGYVDPTRDWLALLTFSAIALAGIIVWNVWAFDTVSQGGVIGTTTASSPSVFNSSSLDAIHTIFVNRAAEEAKYRTGVYRYADPSQ